MSYTRSGYEWEDSFKKSVRTFLPDAFIYKLIDTHSIEGLLRKLKKTQTQYENFLIPKVPADFILIDEGRTLWVECKSTSNLESFPLRNIKSHQIEFGLSIDGAGGEYIFAIQRNEPRNKRAFLLSVNTLVDISIKLGKSKSIKWNVLERHPRVIEMTREKGSLFNTEELFNVL